MVSACDSKPEPQTAKPAIKVAPNASNLVKPLQELKQDLKPPVVIKPDSAPEGNAPPVSAAKTPG